jgi:hypothetical protein
VPGSTRSSLHHSRDPAKGRKSLRKDSRLEETQPHPNLESNRSNEPSPPLEMSRFLKGTASAPLENSHLLWARRHRPLEILALLRERPQPCHKNTRSDGTSAPEATPEPESHLQVTRGPRRASAASIPAFTSAEANSAATRIPFITALSFEDPCPTMHTPRTPSIGAPPYSL